MLREWTFSLENNLFFLFFFIFVIRTKFKDVKSDSAFIFSKSITSLASKGINSFRALNFKYKLVMQSKFQKSKQKGKICTKLKLF